MMKTLVFLSLGILATHDIVAQEKWTSLFNGKDLSGWDTYIGPSYDTIKKDWNTIRTGLNNDPLNVFSIVNDNGVPAIRISGEAFGGISTEQEFENYHLKLEFKWGILKSHPRKNSKRDSGLLYHAIGEHGADNGFWMRSQEFQIQEGDCGDYWGVAGGSFEIPVSKLAKDEYRYDPNGAMLKFNEASKNGRHCIKNPDAENPNGVYNTLEIYCFKDTAIHILNGKVVMILYHSAYVDHDQEFPLTKGKLQIQSEGAEIFYKNIQITKIKKLPKNLTAILRN